MPASLEESLRNLENDHAFLLKGNVFTEDVIETWITYKREKEIDQVRIRPHPYEFFLYYEDRKSTRLNSSHLVISYAVFCLKKKKNKTQKHRLSNIKQ